MSVCLSIHHGISLCGRKTGADDLVVVAAVVVVVVVVVVVGAL